MKARVTWVFAAAMVLGCGGSDGPSDGGAADAPGPDGGSTTGVDIPWLEDGAPPIAAPELTPCPIGWREVGLGPVTCDPYPEGGALDCPPGEAHFPGDPGCAAVGSACPTGEFSGVLPSDRRIVYVQPGATGGDGASPTTPYDSVSEFALGGLPMGSVIALSRGTHVGPMNLARGIVLWGACAGQTVLGTSVPDDLGGVVRILNASGEVRDLTIADSPRMGVLMVAVDGGAADAVVDGVEVTGVQMAGVLNDGGQLAVANLAVHRTRSRGDGFFGRGIVVENGNADITRAVVSQNRDVGVSTNASTVTLADLAVFDTTGQSLDGTAGRGLGVAGDTNATRVVLDGNAEIGMYVESGAVTVTDLVIRDTVAQTSDGTNGRGLSLQGDSTVVEVTRALVARNRDSGIHVSIDATVTVEDMIVRDTDSRMSDGTGGRGVNVQDGASSTLTRVLLERNREVAFSAADTGVATLTDVSALDTLPRTGDGARGRGATLLNGISAELTRVRFEQSRGTGIVMHGTGTTATLTDVLVRDVDGQQNDRARGRGIAAQFGARGDLTRVLVERSHDLGLWAAGGETSLTMTDVVVRDTESRLIDGVYGWGLGVQQDATARATRAVFERNRDFGVVSIDGANVELSQVVVRDTRVRACASTTCAELHGGTGGGSFQGASLSMTDFVVAGTELCGLLLARDAELDLSAGEVRDNPIGVCLQIDGYDLDRLTTDVAFADNGVNLDATSLPIPEPAEVTPEGP